MTQAHRKRRVSGRVSGRAFGRVFWMNLAALVPVLALAPSTAKASAISTDLEMDVVSSDVVSYAVAPDAGAVGRSATALRDALRSQGVKNVILPGDNIYNVKLTYEKVWGPWKQQGFQFPVVAIGNHNIGYKNEIAYFKMPGEFYSTVLGASRFIVLNSDNPSTAREQADFLRRELTQAREDFVFVVFHHPSYTISPHHSAKEKQRFHDAVRPILQEHSDRISALFAGHDHIAGVFTLNELPMVVSGAGVFALKPPKAFSRKEGSVTVRSEWLYKDIQSWARLDIDGRSGEAWVHFIEVKSGKVSCSALVNKRPIRLAANCAS